MRRRSLTPNYTHGSAFLHRKYVTRIADLPLPTSHQYWGQAPNFLCRCNLLQVRYQRIVVLAAQEFGDRFCASPHLELLVNTADVSVHGFVADAELVGNLLVNQPLA